MAAPYEQRLREAFATVQRLLGTQFDFDFAPDNENRPKDDTTILTLARSARGREDPMCFLVYYSARAGELGDPLTDALHEVIHCATHDLYDDGARRLRAAEIVALLKTWERTCYNLERAIHPLVEYWTFPWYARILRRRPR